MTPYVLVVLFLTGQHPYARTYASYDACEEGRAETVQMFSQYLPIKTAICKPAMKG